MLPDGTKAVAPWDAAVVGQEFQADPVALGQVAIGLLDVLRSCGTPPPNTPTSGRACAPTTPPGWLSSLASRLPHGA